MAWSLQDILEQGLAVASPKVGIVAQAAKHGANAALDAKGLVKPVADLLVDGSIQPSDDKTYMEGEKGFTAALPENLRRLGPSAYTVLQDVNDTDLGLSASSLKTLVKPGASLRSVLTGDHLDQDKMRELRTTAASKLKTTLSNRLTDPSAWWTAANSGLLNPYNINDNAKDLQALTDHITKNPRLLNYAIKDPIKRTAAAWALPSLAGDGKVEAQFKTFANNKWDEYKPWVYGLGGLLLAGGGIASLALFKSMFGGRGGNGQQTAAPALADNKRGYNLSGREWGAV